LPVARKLLGGSVFAEPPSQEIRDSRFEFRRECRHERGRCGIVFLRTHGARVLRIPARVLAYQNTPTIGSSKSRGIRMPFL
jgi:hypothetical protein